MFKISESPFASTLPVRVAKVDPLRWQDADGRWYSVGDILETGEIVGRPGELIKSGVVYIAANNLEAAQKHGWKLADRENPAHLVTVLRRP